MAEPDIAAWFIEEYNKESISQRRKDPAELTQRQYCLSHCRREVCLIYFLYRNVQPRTKKLRAVLPSSKADLDEHSDTTGPSLMLLFFFLAKYPNEAEKIYEELTRIDPHDLNALANLPHLNGVINESMRLLPAALSMGTRMTPAEGLLVDGNFIPGNKKIAAPRYSILRRQCAQKNP